MLTINPIKLNTFTKKYISFGETKEPDTQAGLMSLEKNQNSKINFEKDMFEAKNADMVQTNPIKALGYNFVKAYNTLVTPTRKNSKTESTYIHMPYMA